MSDTDKPYSIVLMDPPWRFDSTPPGGSSSRSVENQYPTMTPAEICALSAKFTDHIASISRMFLWCPDSHLEVGAAVLRAWGYRPVKTAFVWVKLERAALTEKSAKRAIADGENLVYTRDYGWRRLRFGAGRTTRNGTEQCLLGARGDLRVGDAGVRQVILAPIGRHSAKPSEQYARIQRLYPGERYLELFARNRAPGWAAWGNEVPQ